ncbi:Pyruvate/2-oxoglutarate dehydrogenase complex, dihydrolipoamide acyltransferase (E2) component [Candidatus Rhodobacter oscarellae]|uniref:Pyruvate/2-oxoglutarate dehydrogenase complex, dihydrolipoamide acyltransferase (E2) component n=1 Tax=Candidatus Rhodobacter oscarellae TaxID=1675527 RepID=A0A0J9EBL1_9RHOB|nr:DUF3035 domain-containing protein [Candidatus Rhodobacter lobularis]KMW60155.1 Pyruvate/2-oxoglutarate dehydrogenase complex, dihydrolipoamide acyltransferase (E2) component [Candidatus Rhodobacter lobularis]
MRATGTKILVVLLAVSLMAGCSRNKEPRLLNISSSTDGPDEFSILPNKPLQEPPSFKELPTPTPGGANRVDPAPEADAIIALGGNPAAASRGIPSSDSGLVSYASRNGRSGTIRQQLASEDLEFRRRNDGRILERLFNVNVYFRAYQNQSLDQYAELERFRRAGVRTPAAPPPEVAEQ